MKKKRKSKKWVDKNLPFTYLDQIRLKDFLQICEEALKLETKRLSNLKRLYMKQIGLIFFKYHPNPLRIINIYDFLSIEYEKNRSKKLSIENCDKVSFKVGTYESERYKIKKILKYLVNRNVLVKSGLKYWINIEGFKLHCHTKSQKRLIEQFPQNVDDFYNIINSKSNIRISKKSADYFLDQIEKAIKITIKKSEERFNNNPKTQNNQDLSEIPFYIIYKTVNEHFILENC